MERQREVQLRRHREGNAPTASLLHAPFAHIGGRAADAHQRARQFEGISASKSPRPRTCGRPGESGVRWFLPRTHR
jgi:hypothetical protein